MIAARLTGKLPGPFRYRHQGDLATIGRHSAVTDFGWLRCGAIRPGGCGAAHVYFLIGVRNRVLVVTQWLCLT